MEKIYSKIEPNKLLHIIVRKDEIKNGRLDIVPEDNFIQCSILNLEKNNVPKSDINQEQNLFKYIYTLYFELTILKNIFII